MADGDVTYWEYEDETPDVVDYSQDDDDPGFLGPTPFPLPTRVSAWFRKNAYRGAHRW